MKKYELALKQLPGEDNGEDRFMLTTPNSQVAESVERLGTNGTQGIREVRGKLLREKEWGQSKGSITRNYFLPIPSTQFL